MKNKILFTALAVMLSLSAFSQKFVNLSAGYSFPVGRFANPKSDGYRSGGAQPGLSFNLDAGICPKNIGFVATVKYRINNYEASELVSSDPYRALVFAIGPVYELQLGEKYAVDFKVQGGTITNFKQDQHYYENLTDVFRTRESATNAALIGGMNFRRNLTNKLSLSLNIDCLFATMKTKANDHLIFNGDEKDEGRTSSVTKNSVNSLNTYLGLRYKI